MYFMTLQYTKKKLIWFSDEPEVRCFKPLWLQSSCYELHTWNNSSQLPWTSSAGLDMNDSTLPNSKHSSDCWENKWGIPTGHRLCCLHDWFQKKSTSWTSPVQASLPSSFLSFSFFRDYSKRKKISWGRGRPVRISVCNSPSLFSLDDRI